MSVAAIPVEQRGKIGGEAYALGLGHKDEEVILEPCVVPKDRLIAFPDCCDPSWDEGTIQATISLVTRKAAIGDYVWANETILLMTKPKHPYFQVDRLAGMVAAGERLHKIKQQTLEPVKNPTQFCTLNELNGFKEEIALIEACLPESLKKDALAKINLSMRELGKYGFACYKDMGINLASYDLRGIRSTIGKVIATAHRVSKQLSYLLSVSRKGSTAHAPMNFSRRVKLVDEALELFSDICASRKCSARSLGYVTQEIKEKWDERDELEPLNIRHARNLFEYTWPTPENLTDAELDRHIQQHPDLDFLETLRAEKRRRTPDM